MRFRVLGPVAIITDDGRPTAIGAAQLRVILAVLLIHHDRVVPADALAQALWGSSPPPSSRSGLQLRVSKLRRYLGTAPVQQPLFQPPGYVLHVEPGALDLDEFVRLARHGSELLERGDAAGASEALHCALALWRGDPLENVDALGIGGYTNRLNELRLAALADRFDADLRLGRRHLVAELESLMAVAPFNERFCGQLMLALYREGRPTEALAVYRRLRACLQAELGLDPGPRLCRLERAILQRDPALEDGRAAVL